MISMQTLLDLWGFIANPFEAYTAEKETRLTDYFVSPPYLDDVIGSADTAVPTIVFGSRGVGKSAIRIYIENLCISGDPNNSMGGRVLAVSYDDFKHALTSHLENVSLELHIEAIVRKMVCAALAHIADALDGQKPTKDAILERFSKLDLDTFGRLTDTYFVSLSELQQEASFRGVYDYFKQVGTNTGDRIKWFRSAWAAIRAPIIDVANIIQAIRGKKQITPTALDKLSRPKADRGSALDDFQSLAAMTKQLGVAAWYILVDKVDEDEHTDGDAAKAAKLIMPLLKNLRTIETQHVAFKFFLWDRLRPILIEESVRFDKLRSVRMAWTDNELKEMIRRRVAAFSANKVRDLTEIVEIGDAIYPLILGITLRSPREIVQVADTIFREHARHSTHENGVIITKDSIDRGVDDYCTRRVVELYPRERLRPFKRFSSSVFTSQDVQSLFRIKQQTAAQRIKGWIENGLVKQIDDTRSKKDASKSVYQYEISEPRLKRLIDRKLAYDADDLADAGIDDE